METLGKFLTTPLGSAVRVFVGLVIGSYVTYLGNGGTFNALAWGDVQLWIGAALVVALPIIVAAVNPMDPRFGAKAR